MHDIRLIRENPDAFDAQMARRGLSSVSAEILRIDAARRARITAVTRRPRSPGWKKRPGSRMRASAKC